MSEYIRQSLAECQSALTRLMQDETVIASIARGASLLATCLRNEGTIFSCGNGGSLCDAMHFAEELTGNFRSRRTALAALALSDPGHLTCTANDFGFEEVYARYLAALASRGDILLAISTSGTSPNIIAAARQARKLDMRIISLTGKHDSTLGSLADIDICTPANKWSDRIQELHIKVIHILIEGLERDLFPEQYAS